MEPSAYIPAYLERCYVASHPDLTEAARSLLHDEVSRHPGTYATTEHAKALVAYGDLHAELMRRLDRMEDLSDEDFEREGDRLFHEMRLKMYDLARADRLCVDARLMDILLSEASIDACLNDLLKLEGDVRSHLERDVPGFDMDAPGFWRQDALSDAQTVGVQVARAAATASNPEVVGWLHILEAISQEALASARYHATMRYARLVMRAEGFPNRAYGTLLLALARLEDEDGFFAAAREAGGDAEDSPWFLLGRTLLLYKLGRRRNARRALRDFAGRCEGGAFFLLNPTYHTPYLPVRPEPREAWDLTHQAVWEADGIIVDTPDFPAWVASVEGMEDLSEEFAHRYGF